MNDEEISPTSVPASRSEEGVCFMAEQAAQRRRQLGLRTHRSERSSQNASLESHRDSTDDNDSLLVNVCSENSVDSQQQLRPHPLGHDLREDDFREAQERMLPTAFDRREVDRLDIIQLSSSSSEGSRSSPSQASSNSTSDTVEANNEQEDDLDEDESLDIVPIEPMSTSSDSSSGYAGPVQGMGYIDDIMAFESDDDEDDDDEDDEESLDYDSDDCDSEIEDCLPDEYLKHDPTPDTQYPKPEWITVNEIRQRKYGYSSSRQRSTRRSNMYWFEKYANNSLWMIQRLQLSRRLGEHTGCVNSLDFNSLGNLICSGSDDLTVCLWDWQLNKLSKRITTGHTNNIFHSEFCNSDTNIITASQDGTVRLVNIETSFTEELLSQSGEVKMLSFITPQTLVSCGTNASVNFIDLRIREPRRLFVVRNPKNGRSCALHSINSHPLDKHKVVVAGASPYVFLYDLRRIARNPLDVEHKPFYCLNHLEDTSTIVTSTAYNSTGDNLLISYNDDDLYVCRTDTCEIVHRYKGHRNKKTIKGCAWFGDNFVMSGSDDGHIYGWDLQSEHIVCFLEGDFKGVVNTLCVHPTLPVLASSGYDHDVKVFEPISKTWPQTLKGIKPHICKNTMRRKRAQERISVFCQYGANSDTLESPPYY